MEHGSVVVVMPSMDVVRMVDVVNVGVATCALGVKTVGPAVREASQWLEAGLGEHVTGPQASIGVVEGNGTWGEFWVD